MKILIGHANMDLDCLGSIALARYLYPKYIPVQTSRLHPSAKNLYNLYRNHLNMLEIKQLKGETIESIVMVDTSSRNRVAEYFRVIEEPEEIIIYDHHQSEYTDFPKAQLKTGSTGANTTLLALECIEKEINIDEKDATIALAGIYADTGHFRHMGLTHQDFEAAQYLMQQGASLNLVNKFVHPLVEKHQVSMVHTLMENLEYKNINGQVIISAYIELDQQMGGLAAVVEKVFEIESSDAIFVMFYFKEENQTLIVGRSRNETVDVESILSDFGGGGHKTAASALIKKQKGNDVKEAFCAHMESRLQPAVLARDIMATSVHTIRTNWTLMEASKFLEELNHTGAPVVNEKDEVTGFMTLRDIMKGRKADNMKAPVTAYMRTSVVSAEPSATLREIERLMFTNNIGHIPIMEKDELLGIITRSDYLKWYR